MILCVENKNLLVETLWPTSTQNVYIFALTYSSRIRERKSQLSWEKSPSQRLRIVDLNRWESILAIIATENIYFSTTDGCCKCTSRNVQSFDLFPFLSEDIVGLTARHPFVLPIVPTYHINLPIQINTWMLFPGICHAFLLVKHVGLSWTKQITAIWWSSTCYENLTSWQCTGWCIVLYLGITNGGKTVDIVDGT